MTIEFALLISGASLIFAIYSGLIGIKRTQSADVRKDASEMTTVIVKLENIGNGITDIKSEITNIQNDQKETRERIIKVEESTKQAHKRLEAIESKKV